MKIKILFCFFFFASQFLSAQTSGIKGTVKDIMTGETLIGANILIGEGKGTVTDINGNYSIITDTGNYTVTVSFVGFKSQSVNVRLGLKTLTLDFSLETQTLTEVEIVADVAVERETPVAFSTVPAIKVQQELGSRDLPMILNSTPGVYATEQGGGSGDARISIRGFDQRNVAVLVDGVPVNDMENGRVYWSNWDGLGDITRSVQVQRGLGASKLALASVGGTMNTITKGIESKLGGSVKQEFGNDNFLKTTIAFTSCQFNNGFGVTLAATKKTGDGWADQTWTDAYSYFFKTQLKLGNHLLSLGANGAPQSHGERRDKRPIANFDRDFAQSLGINTDSIYSKNVTVRARGLEYNQGWGSYVDSTGTFHYVNERINYYYKPIYSFSDFWKPIEKIYVSNIVYFSNGNGGGTELNQGSTVAEIFSSGLQDYQNAYNTNIKTVDKLIDSVLHKSTTILTTRRNDHRWIGILSSVNYSPTNLLSCVFGIDARSYKGIHFRSVNDMLGGDYYRDLSNANQPKGILPGDPNYLYSMKKEGDTIEYYNVGLVKWGGVFAQAEFKSGNWSAFVTASASQTGYQRIDYFKRKDLVIDGKIYEQVVGWGDTLFYNGTDSLLSLRGNKMTFSGDTTFVKKGGKTYSIINASPYTNSSPEARTASSDWLWLPGYTVKGGVNYNLTERQNVFLNFGYLSLAPRFSNVFDNSNHLFWDIKNQFVKAIETGYGIRYRIFAVNLNGYYTIWENKPPDLPSSTTINGESVSYNLNGLDALHKGIEVDFIIKPLKDFEVEGLASIADWIYTTNDTVDITDDVGNVVKRVPFLAKGVHVGNAAQMQFAGSVRYDFFENFYVKARYTYFGKNYSNFDPTTLFGENANRESWRIPDYAIADAYAGYELKDKRNIRYSISAGVFNVLNTIYISDAQNNGVYGNYSSAPAGKGFDATSATVFFSQGRRYNVGLKISF